ncbi:hypothetical protein CCP1ISM_90034 [Azospirillaceae bacterium]
MIGKHTHHFLFDLLLRKIRSLGMERTFQSLTIEELETLTAELIEELSAEDNKKDDEPPF